MLDNLWSSNETIEFYADSAGGSNRGFGIYFQGKWARACWPKDWIDNQLLADITFLEMFPIVVAINIWGASLKNKKILFNNDNQAVIAILYKKTSKSERTQYFV